MLGPQAIADARSRVDRRARAVDRPSARDAHRLEPRHAGARREARNARQPAVDHDANAFDRQARFGDRGGEHDLAPPVGIRTKRAILHRPARSRRRAAMTIARRARARSSSARDATDLAGAGQEDENVAGVVAKRARDGRRHRRLDARRWRAASTYRVSTGNARPSLVMIGASPSSSATGPPSSVADMTSTRRSSRTSACVCSVEREAEVGVEAALVKLVEDEKADAVERRIALQAAREHAFGDDLDARARADARVATHAIADRLANALRRAAGPGGARRRASRVAAARASRSNGRSAMPRRGERAGRASFCRRPAALAKPPLSMTARSFAGAERQGLSEAAEERWRCYPYPGARGRAPRSGLEDDQEARRLPELLGLIDAQAT